MTLTEYIRKRRLTKAAGDLTIGASIYDTALKYGYQNQASFTKSFRLMFGITPGILRKNGGNLIAFPPLHFNLTVTGVELNYSIRMIEGFQVIGWVQSFTLLDGVNFHDIPEFWEEKVQSGQWDKLRDLANPDGIHRGAGYGICIHSESGFNRFNYMIGVEPVSELLSPELETRMIPPSTWAVFSGSGSLPGAMETLYRRIFGEWFPATNHEHRGTPELEVYLPEGTSRSVNKFQIWIPLKEK